MYSVNGITTVLLSICISLTHLMIAILIERERIAPGNSDFQHLQFRDFLDSISTSVGGAKDRSECHSVAIGRHVRVHLLKNLVDEQSYVVLFSTRHLFSVDDSSLTSTKAKDSTVSIDEGANVPPENLYS